ALHGTSAEYVPLCRHLAATCVVCRDRHCCAYPRPGASLRHGGGDLPGGISCRGMAGQGVRADGDCASRSRPRGMTQAAHLALHHWSNLPSCAFLLTNSTISKHKPYKKSLAISNTF